MAFNVSVTSRYDGVANYVQLVAADNASDYYPYIQNTHGNFILDNADPYNPTDTPIPPGPTAAVHLQDGPEFPGFHTIGANMSYRAYLRFKPNAGNPAENIWITLGRVDWLWLAAAIYDAGWDLTSSCPPPVFQASDEHPYYTDTLINGLPFD